MSDSCHIPQVKHSDAVSLRQLTIHVSRNLNALRALTPDIPFQDLILTHLILSMVDPETQKAWEMHMANQELSLLADFINFLKGRCKALKLLQDSETTTVKSTPSRRPPHTATKKGQSQQIHL